MPGPKPAASLSLDAHGQQEGPLEGRWLCLTTADAGRAVRLYRAQLSQRLPLGQLRGFTQKEAQAAAAAGGAAGARGGGGGAAAGGSLLHGKGEALLRGLWDLRSPVDRCRWVCAAPSPGGWVGGVGVGLSVGWLGSGAQWSC